MTRRLPTAGHPTYLASQLAHLAWLGAQAVEDEGACDVAA